MPITLKSTGGGSITLDAPSTGTDYKLTTPALGGTVAVQSGALTAGSIPFANTAGHLIQNNSNLFWDNTNGYLGIGIAAPSYKFHVYQATSADVEIGRAHV